MHHYFRNTYTQNSISMRFAYVSQTCLILFQSRRIPKSPGRSVMSQKLMCLGTGDDIHSEWTRTVSMCAQWMNDSVWSEQVWGNSIIEAYPILIWAPVSLVTVCELLGKTSLTWHGEKFPCSTGREPSKFPLGYRAKEYAWLHTNKTQCVWCSFTSFSFLSF